MISTFSGFMSYISPVPGLGYNYPALIEDFNNDGAKDITFVAYGGGLCMF